jgi:hypothetical protein
LKIFKEKKPPTHGFFIFEKIPKMKIGSNNYTK